MSSNDVTSRTLAMAAGIFLLAGLHSAEASRRGRGVVIDTGNGWFSDQMLDLSTNETSDVVCIDEDDSNQDPSLCNPPYFRLPFPLLVDGINYRRLWINENGFLTLGIETSSALTYSETLKNLWDSSKPIIAPFYSAIASNDGSNCSSTTGGDCDISISSFPELTDGNQDQFLTKAFRVTWGVDGEYDPNSTAPESRTRGVYADHPSQDDPFALNRFQVMFVDRGGGDFDLQFNYDYLEWEQPEAATGPRSLVGFKIGKYGLDFSEYYHTYRGLNPESPPSPLPAGIAVCPDAPSVADKTIANFSPDQPLVCNRITFRFTGGVPELVGFTSSLSLTAVAPMAPVYSAEDTTLRWSISNAGPQATSQIALQVFAPNVSLATAAPTNCTKPASFIICMLPAINAGQNVEFELPVRTMDSGPVVLDGSVVALQYDPIRDDNHAAMDVTFLANSDVRLDGCVGVSGVLVGAASTSTCTITNLGPQAATSVQLAVTLPPQLQFISGAGCTANGSLVTCTAASLAAGASTTFSTQLNAIAAGTGSISATVSSATVDRATTNNSASASVSTQSPPAPPPPQSTGSNGGGGGTINLWSLVALTLTVISRWIFQRRRRESGAPEGNGRSCA